MHLIFAVQLWQLHNAEQMIMDDMESNPDKYKDKKLTELSDDEDFDEENNVEYTKAYYQKALLPKMIVVSAFPQGIALMCFSNPFTNAAPSYWQKISVKELDLEGALAERQV